MGAQHDQGSYAAGGGASMISTKSAADAVGKSPRAFRVWARRHGVRPSMVVRAGRSTCLVWDADEVLSVLASAPVTQVTPQPLDYRTDYGRVVVRRAGWASPREGEMTTTTASILDRLNAYDAQSPVGNIWQDVILDLDIDEESTSETDPSWSSDRFVLADGRSFRWDAARHPGDRWVEA